MVTIKESLTFDDVLLLPKYSNVLPSDPGRGLPPMINCVEKSTVLDINCSLISSF